MEHIFKQRYAKGPATGVSGVEQSMTEAGSAMLEFILIMIVVLPFLFWIGDLGWVEVHTGEVSDALYSGTRAASMIEYDNAGNPANCDDYIARATQLVTDAANIAQGIDHATIAVSTDIVALLPNTGPDGVSASLRSECAIRVQLAADYTCLICVIGGGQFDDTALFRIRSKSALCRPVAAAGGACENY